MKIVLYFMYIGVCKNRETLSGKESLQNEKEKDS